MSNRTFRTVLLVAAVALLGSITVMAHEAAGDVEAAKRAIRIADLELAKAVADRNLERFVELVGEDAVFFGQGISRGRDAVAKAWLPFFTDGSLFLKWQPTQVEVSSSADLGYSIGAFQRIGKNAAGRPETATGNYVSIWRKQPDGKWKVVLDIGTPASPRKP